MLIRNFSHKGLQRLYDEGQTKGVPAACLKKLRRMLAFLDAMDSENELRNLSLWKTHQLKGDRKGTWSFHVTGNWCLTFSVAQDELSDVNFEDYH